MAFYASGNLALPSDLKSALTKISMGNIGATQASCQSGAYGTNTTTASIELMCSYGVIDAIKTFGQMSQAQYVDCASYEATLTGQNTTAFNFPFTPNSC